LSLVQMQEFFNLKHVFSITTNVHRNDMEANQSSSTIKQRVVCARLHRKKCVFGTYQLDINALKSKQIFLIEYNKKVYERAGYKVKFMHLEKLK
jgi:hypothetical protein